VVHLARLQQRAACQVAGQELAPHQSQVIDQAAVRVRWNEERALTVAPAFTGVTAAIHQIHGLLTASRHCIDAAALQFMVLEHYCQQELMIDASGHPPIKIAAERTRYRSAPTCLTDPVVGREGGQAGCTDLAPLTGSNADPGRYISGWR
jgi:hypothetical protein